MKKLLVLFLVSFMSLSVIFATNTQKIHSIDSEVYDAITLLYISNGYALPSTGGPWSSDELLLMLRKIDLNSLNDGAKATYDYVLANPPFGKKSSQTFTNEEGEQEKDDLTYNRQDFWATTSNKQLNFVQHIRTMLKTTGKASVVVPDNVLFEGGAGEIVRKKLLETTDLHTIL